MAMSATMTVPSNVIAGRPVTAMLLIANTGGSDVTVSTVQPVVTPSGPNAAKQPAVFAPEVAFPIGRTKTVAATSGTLYVPMEVVFLLPQTPGLGPVTAGGAFLLDAVITVSDGTVCSVTNPKWVSVSSGAPSPSQGYGQFRFDDGRNLINIVLL
jgi:hypothetical protein